MHCISDPACTVDLPILLQAHNDQCITADHASISWTQNQVFFKSIHPELEHVASRGVQKMKIRRLDADQDSDVGLANQEDTRCVAFDVLPFAISWTGCRINLFATEFLRTFSIQGQHLCDFSWKAENGTVWKNDMSLFGIRQIHTCNDIGFSCVPEGCVRVISVSMDSLRWYDVHFTEGSAVEDLRRAEQFLVGPSIRITNPHDHNGSRISEQNPVPSQQIHILLKAHRSMDGVDLQQLSF